MMAKKGGHLILAAILALVAVPAFAQFGFSEGYSFLKAVRERDGAKVTAAVSDPSSSVINHRDGSTGEGALHIVVRARDYTWLSYLLGHGARPDIQNNEGATPLLIAAQIGWQQGAERLIAQRANLNLGNSQGETPLILAVQRRDVAMVRLLLAQGADPNQSDMMQGYSAIEYARRDPRAAAILRLLEEAPAATAR